MTSFLRHLGVAALLTTSGLLGQTSTTPPVIPAGPLLTLHIDGPAALRAAFLPTNLGKMFAGPEFKDMLAPFMQMYEGMKEQGGGQLPFDPNVFEKALLDYRGRLSIAAHLLDEKIDFTAPEPPDYMVTITLSPDGHTDLAAMCAKAKEIAGGMLGDRLAEVEVAGKTISYTKERSGPPVSLPFMHKDHAVILVTQNFERAGKLLLTAEQSHTAAQAFAQASIGVSLNTKKILALVADAAAQNVGPTWSRIGTHIFKRSGVQSMDSIEVTFRAQGPAVLSEQIITFNPGDRGLLGMFCPVQSGKSPLIDILPRNAISATAMPFDLKKLFAIIKATFADIGDNAPMSFDEFLAGFKEEAGLRLKEDILDTFGDGVLSVQMASEDEVDPRNPMSSINGLCIGFQMTDGATFNKSLDTLLRANGLHAGRKKSDYKGNDIYSMNVMMVLDLNYVVTDKLFLLGVGNASGDAIRAILDESKSIADGKEPAPLPQPVLDRLKMVKGGWSGLTWSDLEGAMGGLVNSLDSVAADLPPQLGGLLAMLEKMPTLLKNYKVQHQVGIMTAQGNRWVYQNIW